MKSFIFSTLAFLCLSLSAQTTTTYKLYRVGNTASEPTSPWVTDGGSCRIGVFEDGVYKNDLNLSVTINNDKSASGNNAKSNINNQMMLIRVPNMGNYIFTPVDFFVTGDESLVDHYEACCYMHKNAGTYPLLDATDTNGTFTGQNGTYLTDATNEPTIVYNVPVHPQLGEGQNSYDAYKMQSHVLADGSRFIDSAEGFLLADDGNGVVTATFYIRVYFKEETGLAPVCFDLQNSQNHLKKQVVTEVEDLNVEDNVAPVYYDLNGRVVKSEQMGQGIYIKRTGNKSEKVLVR